MPSYVERPCKVWVWNVPQKFIGWKRLVSKAKVSRDEALETLISSIDWFTSWSLIFWERAYHKSLHCLFTSFWPLSLSVPLLHRVCGTSSGRLWRSWLSLIKLLDQWLLHCLSSKSPRMRWQQLLPLLLLWFDNKKKLEISWRRWLDWSQETRCPESAGSSLKRSTPLPPLTSFLSFLVLGVGRDQGRIRVWREVEV